MLSIPGSRKKKKMLFRLNCSLKQFQDQGWTPRKLLAWMGRGAGVMRRCQPHCHFGCRMMTWNEMKAMVGVNNFGAVIVVVAVACLPLFRLFFLFGHFLGVVGCR